MSDISIKRDIRTSHEETGEWGFWDKKSQPKTRTFDQLLDELTKPNKTKGETSLTEGIHEMLEDGKKYKPYADLDWKDGITKANFKQRHAEILWDGRQIMEKCFPEGNVHTFCSSGKKPDGTWKVSAHYIVTEIYYESKAHIKHELTKVLGDPKTWEAQGWDSGVYSANHLFRLPGTTKPDDPRKLRYCEVRNMGGEKFVTYPDEDLESDLATGLITFIGPDDVRMPAPDDYVELVRADQVFAQAKPLTDDEKVQRWEALQLAVPALSQQRASTHETRTNVIWALRRVGEELGRVEDCRKLACAFAQLRNDGRYSETKVNEHFWTKMREHGYGYKKLREWATEDKPGWDAALSFDIPWKQGDEFDIKLIKDRIRGISQKDHVRKFQDAVVAYLNHYYTFIKWGRKPFIIEETFQINTEGQRVKVLDYKDAGSLKLIFKNCGMSYTLPGKKVPEVVHFNPYDCWLEHPQRNQKDRLYFNPRVVEGAQFADPRAYNLFDGLAITHDMCKDAPELKEDSPFLQHILKRWCQGSRKLYDSVLNRFALQIQKPWLKHGTGLGLMSPEGSGKGIVLSRIIAILGAKYVFTPGSPDQVLGKFNAGVEGKLVVFCDELTWGGDKEREGAFKRLSTETTIGIERKGIDAIQIESCHNLWAASNEDWMVAASKKARRLEILKLSAELAGNQTAETEKLIADILAVDTLSIAKFFYERKIDDYNPRKVIQTDALRSQKIESMNAVDAAMMQIINCGIVTVNGQERSIGGGTFEKTTFFQAVGSNIKFMTETKFWMKVQELFPSLEFDRPQINNKRVRVAIFSELDTLRNDFRKMYDDPEWPFDEPDEPHSLEDMQDD